MNLDDVDSFLDQPTNRVQTGNADFGAFRGIYSCVGIAPGNLSQVRNPECRNSPAVDIGKSVLFSKVADG
jgi:hypothetical protein